MLARFVVGSHIRHHPAQVAVTNGDDTSFTQPPNSHGVRPLPQDVLTSMLRRRFILNSIRWIRTKCLNCTLS